MEKIAICGIIAEAYISPVSKRHTLLYDKSVGKYFNWNDEKNSLLIRERGISFEEVVFCIQNGGILDRVEHPNKDKYPNQRIFIVLINDYVYLVPYVENEDEIFLKTIIPSRKQRKNI